MDKPDRSRLEIQVRKLRVAKKKVKRDGKYLLRKSAGSLIFACHVARPQDCRTALTAESPAPGYRAASVSWRRPPPLLLHVTAGNAPALPARAYL
jgi:hypothetical protein